MELPTYCVCPFQMCILLGCEDFNSLPTKGVSVKPLKVQLLAAEQSLQPSIFVGLPEMMAFPFWFLSSGGQEELCAAGADGGRLPKGGLHQAEATGGGGCGGGFVGGKERGGRKGGRERGGGKGMVGGGLPKGAGV